MKLNLSKIKNNNVHYEEFGKELMTNTISYMLSEMKVNDDSKIMTFRIGDTVLTCEKIGAN